MRSTFALMLATTLVGCGGGDGPSGGAGGAPATASGSAGANSTASGNGGSSTGAAPGSGGGGASAGGGGGAPPACDLFVANAPAGSADCSSRSDACTFTVLWTKTSAALAGKTTCVLGSDPSGDGHYTGADDMLTPPSTIAGTAGNYVKIVAYEDGKVDIDGEGVRGPLRLAQGNDYFWIEGFDVHSSGAGAAVVSVSGNHNVLRRMVGWDAMLDHNTHVFSLFGHTADDDTSGFDNLLEDDAAFGVGRKMFETFDSHGNTFRRCWARWEGSINTGPKRDIQINYHSYNTVIDDFIARWDGRLMPDSYVIMNNGTPCDSATCSCTEGTRLPDGSCQYDHGFVQGADGAVGEIDWTASVDPSPDGHDTISGVLALVRASDVYQCSPSDTAYGAVSPATFGDQTFRDVFVYIEPGTVDRNKGLAPVGLSLFDPSATGAMPSSGTNLTSIAEGMDTIGSTWTISNYLKGTTLADLGQNNTLYKGTDGAHLCHRYENGTLTSDPLWPWPMSQRIHDATKRASGDEHHHAIEDVDSVVQGVFGSYPAACRATAP